jgi:putative oxidoreductase
MRLAISDTFVNTAIRVVVGGIFVYAGVVKMMDPWAFAAAITSFRILPPILITPAVLTLPALELMAGLLWMLNRLVVGAATTIFGLCALFAVALGTAILRGLPVNCGCFGAALGGSTPTVALLRDVFFLAATGYWLFSARLRTFSRKNAR